MRTHGEVERRFIIALASGRVADSSCDRTNVDERIRSGQNKSPSCRDSDGEAPLVWAAAAGRAQVVQLLTQHGTDAHFACPISLLVTIK